MSGNEPNYQLISSLRYDKDALPCAEWNTSRNHDKRSPYLLLPYTVDRLIRAAKIHSWAAPSELTLDWLESQCDASLEHKDLGQPYKVLSRSMKWVYPLTHRIVDPYRPLTTGENLGSIHTCPKAKWAGRPFRCCYLKPNFRLAGIRTPNLRVS